MSTSRRDFLRTSAAAGAMTLGLGAQGAAAELVRPRSISPSPRHPLKILILGGTNFSGPQLVRYALERGHAVSTFTRGQTKPTVHTRLFNEVEQLIGDRENNLDALRGRTWDTVIDNSGRNVQWTTDSAELLKDSVQNYMYTSSTGVYLPYLGMDIKEDTELVLEDPPEVPESNRPTYGVMKSLSEMEARRIFGEDRAIIVRPTYIVGPADPTERWHYWPLRLERGGEVFVPGRGSDPVQYIDVRDLAEFMIRLAENQAAGTYNVAGPGSFQGMHDFVHGVRAAFSSDVSWVMGTDYDFLRENNIRFTIPWIMPVDDYVGSARANIDRAKAAGLTFRPLAQTCWDTMEWWYSSAVSDERRNAAFQGPRGLSPEREAQVIAAWKARS